MNKPAKESELAAQVIAYLEGEGFEVFQEVRCPDGICDIVAKRGTHVIACEVKVLLSWELLAQAREWTAYANRTWIATPYFKREWRQSHLIKQMLDWMGIGYLVVAGEAVRPWHVAPLHESANTGYFTQILRPEHKTYAKAGTNRGGYFTEWKGVAAAVAQYVSDHPNGVPIKEIVLKVPAVLAYYKKPATAIRNIRVWCKSGAIKHVRYENSNGLSLVYPHLTQNSTEPRI